MKKKWAININEVPSNSTVEKFIRNHTDINTHIANLKAAHSENYIEAQLLYPIEELKQSLLKSLKDIQSYSFDYHGREKKFESYLSTTLTWNPEAIDNLSADPHQSGLGSSLYSEGNAGFYEAMESSKNSYADTYSFNKKTPLANTEGLKKLLDTFQRSLIRSRVSFIKANHEESTKLNYLWHQDESVFLNLRINIPVQSNEHYVIQLLNEKDNLADIAEFALIPGNAYVYNTEKYHRPFCKKLNETDRINLICGISPWFDYHEESNSWISNEYYGEVHPFDMFRQGHVTKLIKQT